MNEDFLRAPEQGNTDNGRGFIVLFLRVMHLITYIYHLLRDTVLGFNKDKGFKHGAAISYYTIFSLPAILMIIIYSAGSLLGESMVRSEILNLIAEYLGAENAVEIDQMISHLNKESSSIWATLLGIGTLIFGATGVFYTLQDSLNTIWKIPEKIERIDGIGGMIKLVLDRMLSLAMVLTLGFILLVSMVLDMLIVGINRAIHNLEESVTSLLADIWPWFVKLLAEIDVIFLVAYSLDLLVGILVITLVFALIFRFLPSARIPWRDVWLGAFLTATLFTLGKTLISWYIAHSNVTSTYGAAGSVILILLWVFFSSQIFLLGAEFIYVFCKSRGREIQPAQFVLSITDQPIERLKTWSKDIWNKFGQPSPDEQTKAEQIQEEDSHIIHPS
ncbi:MAG: YihY/virulence factor BrkB family protein [Bacteroidota bacterium]